MMDILPYNSQPLTIDSTFNVVENVYTDGTLLTFVKPSTDGTPYTLKNGDHFLLYDFETNGLISTNSDKLIIPQIYEFSFMVVVYYKKQFQILEKCKVNGDGQVFCMIFNSFLEKYNNSIFVTSHNGMHFDNIISWAYLKFYNMLNLKNVRFLDTICILQDKYHKTLKNSAIAVELSKADTRFDDFVQNAHSSDADIFMTLINLVHGLNFKYFTEDDILNSITKLLATERSIKHQKVSTYIDTDTYTIPSNALFTTRRSFNEDDQINKPLTLNLRRKKLRSK